ncbi:Ig-like domain repeat protein [Pseudolysobacter antarcticus]|uniref:Ig-like domain repeat protein n=1 Tax=Pseudolysobacter antarcticus TaxID=2511995 RepID=A0A411HK54_9GAMM|nr:Ig-like domain-containing protein [Pseudolysobacter antarcticus]QBB70784.1 Ig-like domain repeat protein [Pseudolysobacter antarcticus]
MKSKWCVKGFRACGSLLVRMFSVAVLVSAFAVPGHAKMYEEPRSFSLKDKSQEQVERKVLPKINIERLLAEDRDRGKDLQRPGPHRFAVAADQAYTLDKAGTWQTLADGRLWRLRINSPGAKSLSLGITRFDLPEGAKLWIYNPAHTAVEGPYTARNRSHLGSLWTPVIQGDEIVVEVFAPAGGSQPVIEIGKINQGYRGFEKNVPGGGTEGTCENDVVCPVGDPWRKQIRAVGVYTKNGTADCTGTLLNDTAHDFKPYFLSANHCGVDSTSDATIVVYWNYEATTCGTHGPGSTADNQSGSTFRASYAPSDFLLFELDAKPDPSFNVFYAGWDATGAIPPSEVGIHHPAADVKAISFANSAADTTAYNSPTHDPAGNHWRVLWNSGVTEPGSSGSCLFNASNQRCIGQLHGGPSICGGADLHDYYGRLSVSWNGGGTSATRLKDWLDPGNTGSLGLDGDPHITTANGVHYDFQSAGEFVSLRDADGLEIQTRQTPIATTFNPGADAHDGLATCVSLNTAVAARVSKHRVTYEPNLSGVPDPSGLQLRVDGVLTTLGASGHDLAGGGRIAKTAAAGGLEIVFPDSSVLYVTPGWWADQAKWFLNVDVVRPPSSDGASPGSFPTGGIAGAIAPDNWLPALPDGSSMGAMPAALHQRYVDLYQKFADAWRVTDKTTLFDYAPGKSTESFTVRSWPLEKPPCVLPESKPARPVNQDIAERVCRPVAGENAHNNCVFDVMVTGNLEFGKTYALTQQIQANSTRITLSDDRDPSKPGEPVIFTATVSRAVATNDRAPAGSVQFSIDGKKVGRPVRLDANGQAQWKTTSLKPGAHKVSASYIAIKDGALLPSVSADQQHTVKDGGYDRS